MFDIRQDIVVEHEVESEDQPEEYGKDKTVQEQLHEVGHRATSSLLHEALVMNLIRQVILIIEYIPLSIQKISSLAFYECGGLPPISGDLGFRVEPKLANPSEST